MPDGNRKPKKIPIINIMLTAICLALLAIATLLRDEAVIRWGVRAYGRTRTILIAATCASAAWLGAACFLRARTVVRGASSGTPEPDADRHAMTEEIRNGLYDELARFGEQKWSGMAQIGEIQAQLDSMNAYQAEMGRLLEQTAYLKTKPAEIIQQVEDCMYVNVRKLINYMRIVQTKDSATMAAKIRECAAKNAGLLKKTDDFVVAVVGYVNDDIAPGEEQKTQDYVDSYMFVVLEAIDLPETYLK